MRTRLIYLATAAAVLLMGLASRSYRSQLPTFVAEYAGDSFWALLLFLLISATFAGRRLRERIALALVLALLVELSQLYHAPWIDSLRRTTLGGLVLGFGFLWTDLWCYAVGIALGAVVESLAKRVIGKIQARRAT